MRLTRFVRGTYTYTFPNTQINASDNFADMVTQTVRMPGADGGFDALGDGRGLNEVGSVRAEFWLHHTYGTATTDVDAFRRMADAGVGRLYMQPTSANQSERWAWVRVNSINHADAARDVPDRRMRMKIVWQASDPFWYGVGNSVVWGGGATWGGGTKWGGGAPVSASGVSTTTTLTNNGNTHTYLQATVRPDVGQSAGDVIIRRVRDGAVEDEVRYAGTVSAGSNLVIDSRRRDVRLNDVGVYGTQFSASAGWLRLLPGANTIEIKFAQASDAASVNLRYLERWV